MKILSAIVLIIALLLSSVCMAIPDVHVISNTGTSVTAGDIKDIFLAEKQFSGSVKLIPIDNASAQEEFIVKVMKMDNSRYNNIWTKKSFREGINPPAVKSGDAEVLEFVRRTPGAIGYVRSAPSGVSVIKKY